MLVIKRDGRKQKVMFDKITERVSRLCDGLNRAYVDPVIITQKVVNGIYDCVTTTELDELTAETSAHMISTHPDYGKLAARISASNLHKSTHRCFSKTMKDLYEYVDPKTGLCAQLIDEKVYHMSQKYKHVLDKKTNYAMDYEYDYFGFKTLKRSYLLKLNGVVVENPQDMLMRVSLGFHGEDIESAILTYEGMSSGLFIHATPTLFNSGTPNPQMSSCFLLKMKEDSIDGIFETLGQCAKISKSAGGIGLSIHNVRATGSYIRGTNGISNGIVPMLRVFSSAARYVDQGGGKRKGAFAIYLEPWHADIYEFLELRKNHGSEEMRARDLFCGLWINDLFMKRVKLQGNWSLFCPNEAPGLSNVWGKQFEDLYEQYEREGRARKVVNATELFLKIVESQVETGGPYMLYKDACNRKSNQQNLGTISCSNLCTEIVQYTSPEEVAVCNLASIALPKMVKKMYIGDNNNNTVSTNYTGDTSQRKSFGFSSFYLIGEEEEEESGECLHFISPSHSSKNKNRSDDEEGDDDDSSSHSGNENDPLCSISYLQEIQQFPQKQNEINADELHIIKKRRTKKYGYVFDFAELNRVVRIVTRNLNLVIDKNMYPVPESQNSNLKHRPIGVGVQGLADVFMMLHLDFESKEALELNRQIFEVIYYSALEESCSLAKSHGPYQSYQGSPISQGLLQMDLWAREAKESHLRQLPSMAAHYCDVGCDWDELRANIQLYGVRNSLLVAPMPTASTSQILGNYECFEPCSSNLFTRRVLAGEFTVINKHLVRDLTRLGLWNLGLKDEIVAANGSVQGIKCIPEKLKGVYKTAYEMKQKSILNMAIIRGPYIDQSQSMNVFMDNPSNGKLSSMHFHAWEHGLKTGMYYLRTKPAVDAIKFTIDQNTIQKAAFNQNERQEEHEKLRKNIPQTFSRDLNFVVCGSASSSSTQEEATCDSCGA